MYEKIIFTDSPGGQKFALPSFFGQDMPQALGGGGSCRYCGREHQFASGAAWREAVALMRLLGEHQRIDFSVPAAAADPRFATDYLFGEARGQMFGVMVCRGQDENTQVLRAFSGQYNGEWEVDGWVGPLFDVAAFRALACDVEQEVKELGVRIDALAEEDSEKAVLRRERRELSRKLMQELHALYALHNFRGEVRSLAEAFIGPSGIPTGAGDCCAPKLLDHAARNKLIPLGIAEFYWGRENRSKTREHGRFYAACREKCAPILGFMLCGLEEEQGKL